MIHICDRCNKSFKKLWMLTRHLNNKFPCKPKVLDLLPTFRTHAPKIVHTLKTSDPIPQIEPDTNNSLDQVSVTSGPSTQSYPKDLDKEYSNSQTETDNYISREEF
ncbi:14981_t:CDS:1, partial [Gigaspora margarita]